MYKKAMKFFALLLLINAITVLPAFGDSQLTFPNGNTLVGMSLKDIASVLDKNQFSVKSNKPYDQSNDPAFIKSGPADETPQHGYFAVPLLVIGLAAILLYFTRMKD